MYKIIKIASFYKFLMSHNFARIFVNKSNNMTGRLKANIVYSIGRLYNILLSTYMYPYSVHVYMHIWLGFTLNFVLNENLYTGRSGEFYINIYILVHCLNEPHSYNILYYSILFYIAYKNIISKSYQTFWLSLRR